MVTTMHLFREFVFILAIAELNKLSKVDEIFSVYLFFVRYWRRNS